MCEIGKSLCSGATVCGFSCARCAPPIHLKYVWCAPDNLCYLFGLGERLRARVEDAGRVELTDIEANAMGRSKEAHIVTIVSTVLIGVYLLRRIFRLTIDKFSIGLLRLTAGQGSDFPEQIHFRWCVAVF